MNGMDGPLTLNFFFRWLGVEATYQFHFFEFFCWSIWILSKFQKMVVVHWKIEDFYKKTVQKKSAYRVS